MPTFLASWGLFVAPFVVEAANEGYSVEEVFPLFRSSSCKESAIAEKK
jgi:hypothetical protein